MPNPTHCIVCGKLREPAGTARSMCSKHYWRWKRYGDVHYTGKVFQKDLPCTVEQCDKPRAGNGHCATHWMQNKRRGDPEAPRIRGRLWTPEEDRQLLALLDDTLLGIGAARSGEVQELAIHLERSDVACRSRLWFLRKKRRAQLRPDQLLGLEDARFLNRGPNG